MRSVTRSVRCRLCRCPIPDKAGLQSKKWRKLFPPFPFSDHSVANFWQCCRLFFHFVPFMKLTYCLHFYHSFRFRSCTVSFHPTPSLAVHVNVTDVVFQGRRRHTSGRHPLDIRERHHGPVYHARTQAARRVSLVRRPHRHDRPAAGECAGPGGICTGLVWF